MVLDSKHCEFFHSHEVFFYFLFFSKLLMQLNADGVHLQMGKKVMKNWIHQLLIKLVSRHGLTGLTQILIPTRLVSSLPPCHLHTQGFFLSFFFFFSSVSNRSLLRNRIINYCLIFISAIIPDRSQDWNNTKGIKCFNETKPVTKKKYWGSGSDKKMMSVVASVVGKMKVPVTVLNITQLSEYRIDAHTSVYTETGGKMLTDEQKADPLHHADCIHWCLPGVPDTWNQMFLAYL